MAKAKNDRARRKHQEQVRTVEQAQGKRNRPQTRWTLSMVALVLLLCGGFAAVASYNHAVALNYTENAAVAKAAFVGTSSDSTSDSSTHARLIDDEDIDPRTWRNLELVMTKPDGGKLEMSLLRPTWWIQQVGAEAGKTINLSIPEMQLSGPTKVLSIKPMKPEPARGDGVVTGTFKHTSAEVLDLQLEGEKKPIGVTASHPFRSADQNAWIGAGKLKVGEHVVTRNGTTKVVSVKKRRGKEAVYNLEVHGQHTYFVGTTGGGAWVHNVCIAPKLTDNQALNWDDALGKPKPIDIYPPGGGNRITDFDKVIQDGDTYWVLETKSAGFANDPEEWAQNLTAQLDKLQAALASGSPNLPTYLRPPNKVRIGVEFTGGWMEPDLKEAVENALIKWEVGKQIDVGVIWP